MSKFEKVDFETRNYYPNSIEVGGIVTYSLEDATDLCMFKNQCTYDESQTNSNGYSHIMEFRNEEHYQDLYFI